jgi:hypothetical protein
MSLTSGSLQWMMGITKNGGNKMGRWAMKIEIPSGNLTSIDRWFSDSTLHFDRRFPSQGCLIPRGYLQSWGYQGKAFPHSKFQARIFTDSICFGGICNCERKPFRKWR